MVADASERSKVNANLLSFVDVFCLRVVKAPYR